MTHNRRRILPELVVIGALSGFLAAWLLAIELAAIQGVFPLRWVVVAPMDPEIRPFTLATTLSAAFLSVVWYRIEGNRLRPHRISPRWYLKTVAWGLACAALSIALAVAPDFIRSMVQSPASFLVAPLQLLPWGMYGLFFGFPIALVLSPFVVWVAEQVVLRNG